MTLSKNIGILICCTVFAFTAGSCENPAKDVDWGFSRLYMPQAIVQSGGTTNNYFVEIDSTASTDTMVVVGLYRSGLEPVLEVTVDLEVDLDTLNYLISMAAVPNPDSKFEMYKNARLLDEKYYSIPSELSLENGKRDNYDFITLYKNELWVDPAPDETIFILPVRITNPSRYELNQELSITLFIFTRLKPE